MPEIASWLEGVGLQSYTEVFVDNGIDLRALPHLTEQDFKDRRILLAAIEVLPDAESVLEYSEANGSQPAQTQPENRQVTILFADLVGYTKLSSELDTEEIHTLLGHFLDAADRIIVEHGGTVDKHVGDCVMAVFGAPIAHSNDSSRAARAALEIQSAMPVVSKLAGYSLHVHIGLANGQVRGDEARN